MDRARSSWLLLACATAAAASPASGQPPSQPARPASYVPLRVITAHDGAFMIAPAPSRNAGDASSAISPLALRLGAAVQLDRRLVEGTGAQHGPAR